MEQLGFEMQIKTKKMRDIFPANIYFFKVDDENTRKWCGSF